MRRIAVTGAIRDSDDPVGIARKLKLVLRADTTRAGVED